MMNQEVLGTAKAQEVPIMSSPMPVSSTCKGHSSEMVYQTTAMATASSTCPSPVLTQEVSLSGVRMSDRGGDVYTSVSPSTPPGMTARRPSEAEIFAFGGIPDASLVGLRSSDRIRNQPNADSSIMERAMHRAQ